MARKRRHDVAHGVEHCMEFAVSTTFAIAPQALPAISRQWVRAHVLAQIVSLAAAAGVYGLSEFIGSGDPGASQTMKTAAIALALGGELISAVTVAYLRGAVLRKLLPGFPMLGWSLVVIGYLMVMAMFTTLTGDSTSVPMKTMPQVTAPVLLAGFGFLAVLGLIFGLVIGAIEALVLRTVAHGTGQWIKWSGLAWGGAMLLVYVSGLVVLKNPDLSPFMLALLNGAIKISLGLVIGAATVPALTRLTPR